MKPLRIVAAVSCFLTVVFFVALSVTTPVVWAQSCVSTPITAGSPVTGSLDDSDCTAPHRQTTPLGGAAKADLYTFTGTAGQQVSIAMNRSSLQDPYLILVGPDGSIVNDPALDDDRGDGLNSLISNLTLPSSGTYTVEATAWGSTYRGIYTLTLFGGGSLTNNWSGWGLVPGGGRSVSQPAAVLDSTGTLRLYIRGIDNGLWVKRKTGESWSDWSRVPGGGSLSGPAAFLDGTAVRLVVRGLDNSLWTALDDASPIAWQHLGGRIDHSPAALMHIQTPNIFIRGIDGRLYTTHGGADGGGGVSWEDWALVPGGGQTGSQPATVVDSTGTLHLYVEGIDNSIWAKRKSVEAGWGEWWIVPGGSSLNGPAAVLDGDKVRLVVRGLDNGIWTLLSGNPPSIRSPRGLGLIGPTWEGRPWTPQRPSRRWTPSTSSSSVSMGSCT